MKGRRWLVVLALAGTGCFDEGGDEVRTNAAITTAQGLIAFADIHRNLQTDPAAAGEALLEFMKWPVAADNLVSPPFDYSVMDSAARTAPGTPVPECLIQQGNPACESYSTAGECEAGGFTFTGTMTRKCADCDKPELYCAYAWILPTLTYTSDQFKLVLQTSGAWQGFAGAIRPNTSARYNLDLAGADGPGRRSIEGDLKACACTTFTVEAGPPPTGKPKKLVNSSFVVRAIEEDAELDPRCALVSFDGNGNVSVTSSCFCEDGTACRTSGPTASYPDLCGDGECNEHDEETYENCPVDCAEIPSMCPNDICEIGEDAWTCKDCALCGNGICEAGEVAAGYCSADCEGL